MYPFDRATAALTGPPTADLVAVREAVSAGFGNDFTVESAEHRALTTTVLDSADRRLAAAGVGLTGVERGPIIATRGTRRGEGASPRWPALAADLPDGPVRELVGKPLGIRAVVPVASVRTAGAGLVVRNEDEKIVARAAVWTGHLLARHTVTTAHDLPSWVQVFALRGYEKQARVLSRALASDGFHPTAMTWFDLVRGATDDNTVQTPPTTMRPDEPADRAVAAALLRYLDEIEANIDGTIVGRDTEHLHDLRVAVRRTRSVLKLLGDLLPQPVVERARDQFAMLGRITTPTRDLDVYLLDMDALAARVSRPDDLAVFRTLVRTRRAAEQRTLVRALRSERLREDLRGWRDDLDRLLLTPTTHDGTAGEVAARRIRAAFERTAKKARALTAKSPSAKVHALRKSAKELRYLLEVFAPLCDPKAYRRVIADVKAMQDVLGRFQDAEVQSTQLREFAQQLIDGPDRPSANAILTMGDLAGGFDEEQAAARADLDAHHDRYLGKHTARAVEQLVPTP